MRGKQKGESIVVMMFCDARNRGIQLGSGGLGCCRAVLFEGELLGGLPPNPILFFEGSISRLYPIYFYIYTHTQAFYAVMYNIYLFRERERERGRQREREKQIEQRDREI